MILYKYKAVTQDGRQVEGTYEGRDKREVISKIRNDNQTPIKVDEAPKSKDVKDLKIVNKVKTKQISIFCRQFYTMLNSGVTIVNCLDILRKQTESKKLAQTLDDIYEDVLTGSSFSDSVKKHDDVFPSLLINMIDAGEVSGNLDNIMDRMAFHYEKEYKMNNKVKGAMAYPMILGLLSVVVVIFLLTFIMPTFTEMFEDSGVPLPTPTRILLAISDTLTGYWYIFVIVIGIIVYSLIKYIKTTQGRTMFDSIKLKIPIVKRTVADIVTSRFSRTLSTLMMSGVPLIEALDIVSRVVGNKVVENGILDAKEDVRKGTSLSTPLQRIDAFPLMLTQMIEIGEESGSLDDILEKTANFYDEEVDVSIQRLTTMLEPIMIIVMAVVIGFIVISMVLPMFDMVNTI